ncbi:MAG: hypothetical protein QOH16_666 [Gaiellaceae bacterium]|nr:hypothetical protein [Gaiellaceae bacterium]
MVALLFNVSDIVSALERIERLPGEDGGEEEADGGRAGGLGSATGADASERAEDTRARGARAGQAGRERPSAAAGGLAKTTGLHVGLQQLESLRGDLENPEFPDPPVHRPPFGLGRPAADDLNPIAV